MIYPTGLHNATYTMKKTEEGLQFVKVRHGHPVMHAKGNYLKVMWNKEEIWLSPITKTVYQQKLKKVRFNTKTPPTIRLIRLKADMKSYIPLETAAIFFLAKLFLKQDISSEYVMVDFICIGELGLQGAKTENYKMKNSCP